MTSEGKRYSMHVHNSGIGRHFVTKFSMQKSRKCRGGRRVDTAQLKKYFVNEKDIFGL
jgi:hypothetical protein